MKDQDSSQMKGDVFFFETKLEAGDYDTGDGQKMDQALLCM